MDLKIFKIVAPPINRAFLAFWLSLLAFPLMSCSPPGPPAPIINGWREAPAQQGTYLVQKGDTLYSIAWAFEMDFRDLARINHITPPYPLYVGQRLRMSASSVVTPAVITNGLGTTEQFIPQTYHSTIGLPPPTTRQRLQLLNMPQPSLTHKTQASTLPNLGSLNQQSFNGRWLWPVQGKLVRQFTTAPGGNHGIEIAGRLGMPIVASAPGIVVYSGAGLRGYGNLIIIKHNDTYLSAYAYNKKLMVKEGDAVKGGQVIALMGSNNSGQVRLHFEIRRNGKPIDPLKLMKS